MIPKEIPVEATLQEMYPGYSAVLNSWIIVALEDDLHVEIREWNVPGEPQPTDQEIIDASGQGHAKENEEAARIAREESIRVVTEDDMRIASGLVRRIDDATRGEPLAYINDMDSMVDNPSNEAWEPPLPPSVEIPATWSFKLTITRVEGWQGALGWQAVMTDWVEGYFPSNASLSIYSAENCTNFLSTPGAFVQDGDQWVINCPAGQEPVCEALTCRLPPPLGGGAMSWVVEEMASADFGDQRLNARAELLLDRLIAQPSASLPTACRGWSETLAAYRFFDNAKVTAEEVLSQLMVFNIREIGHHGRCRTGPP